MLSEESASNASFCERCEHEFKGVLHYRGSLALR